MCEEDIGAVILSGGKSRRMGSDKSKLKIDRITFLERIASELVSFKEILLSISSNYNYIESFIGSLKVVRDIFEGCGPIGGLFSALEASSAKWLLAISCDMPLFSRGLAEYLCSYISEEFDAIVIVTRDKRVHPLCAIYSQKAKEIFKRQIQSKDYCLLNALKLMKVKYVYLKYSAFPDEILENVNTPEEYIQLCKRIEGPKVLAVSGVKNSGKTTILERIIPILCEKGLNIAVIKHDGHDFTPDVDGTDSYRLREAGACGVAVCSSSRYMIIKDQKIKLEELFNEFLDFDLVLIEGGKNTSIPKLEVVRAEISNAPVCDPATLIGICTDINYILPGVATLHINDYEKIASLILTKLNLYSS